MLTQLHIWPPYGAGTLRGGGHIWLGKSKDPQGAGDPWGRVTESLKHHATCCWLVYVLLPRAGDIAEAGAEAAGLYPAIITSCLQASARTLTVWLPRQPSLKGTAPRTLL